ncbi:cilia- and flagella-associated protein 43-like isoform X2 [Tachypleus tridentatus]
MALDCLLSEAPVCVISRLDGSIEIWNVNTGRQDGKFDIHGEIETACCSPVCPLVVVGTKNGISFFIDASDHQSCRIVHLVRLYHDAVTHLNFDNYGKLLVTGNKTGIIYVISGLPFQHFSILGYIDIQGSITGLSSYRTDTAGPTVVTVVFQSQRCPLDGAGDIITQFSVPSDIISDPKIYQTNQLGELKGDLLKSVTRVLRLPGCGLATHIQQGHITFSPTSRHFQILPVMLTKSISSSGVLTSNNLVVSDHDLRSVYFCLSPSQKWLASTGHDGKLCVYSASHFDRVVSAQVLSHWSGGGTCVSFSVDEKWVIVGGKNGMLTCYKWSPILPIQSNESSGSNHEDVYCLASLPTIGFPTTEKQTYREETIKKIKDEESQMFHLIQLSIKSEMEKLAEEVKQLMAENQTLPPEEQLPLLDFALDPVELQKVQKEGQANIEELRDSLKKEILVNQYLTELIKTECWESMEVKGRCLKAFYSGENVYNYPLPYQSKTDRAELNQVIQIRQIELQEQKARKEITEIKTEVTNEGSMDEKSENQGWETSAFQLGSQRERCSISIPYLHKQTELTSRVLKSQQIILLKEVIYQIKKEFNRKFDALYQEKVKEVGRIQERNKRIKEILNDLGREKSLCEPSWDVEEETERLLVVEDEEITTEKYLSPEERKQEEERLVQERLKRQKEQEDSMKELALQKMMGGVLEVCKEDKFKKDPTPPNFMVSKSQSEWTKEEYQEAKEFEEKVKEFNREKEKLHHQLEMELQKLENAVQDSTTAFNIKLKNLFEYKILTDNIIYQEELMILNLILAQMLETELERWIEFRTKEVQEVEKEKQYNKQAVKDATEIQTLLKEKYENLLTADRVLDKQAKKEFMDYPNGDILYKAFRKKKVQRQRCSMSVDPTCPNPYGAKTTRKQQESLAEENTTPPPLENIGVTAWNHVCELREKKIKIERNIKEKALDLAEITAHVQQLNEEINKLEEQIQQISQELKRVTDLHCRLCTDVKVQLIMKQGQIETEDSEFIPDYSRMLLVQQLAVERPISKIRELGENKILAIKEGQDFHKGIARLEWEHQKLRMTLEDLRQYLHDIQTIRVTRERQKFLAEGYASEPDYEVKVLEKALEIEEEHFLRKVTQYERLDSELQSSIETKTTENGLLSEKIELLNQQVSERKLIHRDEGDYQEKQTAVKRYQGLVRHRQLKQITKEQREQIEIRRQTLQNLQNRNFPNLSLAFSQQV